MKRKTFLKTVSLGALAAPFGLRGMEVRAMPNQQFRTSTNAEDRVLVLVRLSGGNDGLNMVIPLNYYAELTIQRPSLIAPQNSILQLTPELGLHPSMTGLQSLFNDGKLSVIQNVGYPQQNRSHFRSTDIWTSGSQDATTTTGWLGRYFDQNYPNYPDNYPSADYPDPFAISIGSQISATCQGLISNFAQVVNDPFTAINLAGASALNDGTYNGGHLEYISTTVIQSNAYAVQINNAANAGQTLSQLYDLNDAFCVQLRHVARLISGGMKTKVYILQIGGFDTHDLQVMATDPTIGNHANLMNKISKGLTAFQDDLELLGIADRVAGMTFSEFGREMAENGNYGTDHGDAAPLFLFGPCITSPIVGANPIIPNQVSNQSGVPMEIDFRDVYASLLRDWFEVPDAQIQQLFEHQIQFYDLMSGCRASPPATLADLGGPLFYPNPCTEQTTLLINTMEEQVKIELFDATGRLLEVLHDGSMAAGRHDIPVSTHRLRLGEYYIRITRETRTPQTVKFVRLRQN